MAKETASHPSQDVRTVDWNTYATLVPRLLDIEAIEGRIDELEGFLRRVALAQSNEGASDSPTNSDWILDTLDVEATDLDHTVV